MKLSQLNSGEYPVYYKKYLDHLPNEDLISLLFTQKDDFQGFLATLKPGDLDLSYSEGKWTVAEVLQHVLDTERIFQYRALRIARGDKTPLPGYDQDAYVPVSLANSRDLTELTEDFLALRNSGIKLFQSFTKKMLREQGISNGEPLSAAAAGFIMCGHQKHHQILFKTKYSL